MLMRLISWLACNNSVSMNIEGGGTINEDDGMVELAALDTLYYFIQRSVIHYCVYGKPHIADVFGNTKGNNKLCCHCNGSGNSKMNLSNK